MRYINKGPVPDELKRRQDEAACNNLNAEGAYQLLDKTEKEAILNCLMKEQGHLCAYCMRRIPDNRDLPPDTPSVNIEHRIPRNHPDGLETGQGLDYGNLLAVCSGNRGRKHTRKKRDLTCDAKKENSLIKLNPCDQTSISFIRYKQNGYMESQDPDIMADINIKLNLNCISDAVQLPEFRREALEALQDEVAAFTNPKDALAFCKKILLKLEEEQDPRTEYSGIMIWWLKDFIG